MPRHPRLKRLQQAYDDGWKAGEEVAVLFRKNPVFATFCGYFVPLPDKYTGLVLHRAYETGLEESLAYARYRFYLN